MTLVWWFLPPKMTVAAELRFCGATARMPDIWLRMASISRSSKRLASVLALPGPNWPGRTNSMLVPSRDSSDFTCSVVPLPMVTMAMTAATPMTTPSTVRKERSRLRLMARSARRDVSKNI
ncbi:hypothetical protein D3C86_1548140 [compost metagenome]